MHLLFFEEFIQVENLLRYPIFSFHDQIIFQFINIAEQLKLLFKKPMIHAVLIHSGNEFLSNRFQAP
jgi:hypothetical protein